MYKVKYDNYILYKHIDQLLLCQDIVCNFKDERSHNTEINKHPSVQQVPFEVAHQTPASPNKTTNHTRSTQDIFSPKGTLST